MLGETYIAKLAHFTCYRSLRPGEYLWRQGERADACLLILSGEVSLEIGVPGDHAIQIEVLKGRDVLGWSWLLHPYRWHFDARAVIAVRGLALDTRKMRVLCADDHDFGYEILSRCTPLIAERLERTRRLVLELSRPA